ncbi:MSHA biogenesis protein MshG [Thiogranum longum]|uniref:MSHA biogenesis protein MshG n=1 Tax=Thiogranum longum TaxID=1537524 RepID=A0A4R1H8U7_9GAMM|nr:type II secretion system F family protein [Thiogranum longum]TCK16873.1 MSHA biogenesis protein MshG [Thiogranum longum]
MPEFQYKARGHRGDAIEGVIDAPSSDIAATRLIEGGLTPVDIHIAEEKSGLSADLSDLFPAKIELIDLIQFSRQMYSLMKAGVPILSALHGLAVNGRNRTLGRTLNGVIENLEAGRDLSSSLAQFPDVFSVFYVSLVRVGETSGRLDEVFRQLATYLDRELKTRKKVKSALRYPTFVLTAILAAITIINIFVIPAFAEVFKSLGGQLPLPTRILVAMSNATVNHWELLLLGAAVIFVGGHFYINSDAGRYKWHKLQLRLPMVGKVMYKATLARFSRLFALVLNAGVPIVTALSVIGRALNNEFIEERVLSMRDGIERGESVSRTASSTGIFDHLVLQMLEVGEESGTTGELLKDISDYYDDEVDYAIEKLSASIEPTLTIALACLVALLAAGVFLPMWDLYKVAL